MTNPLSEIRPDWFQLNISSNYNKMIAPQQNGCPVIVNVTFFPWKIGEIKFDKMTFQADFYLAIYWSDFRVTLPSNLTNQFGLSEQESSMLWRPVIGFRNSAGSDGEAFDPTIHRIKVDSSSLYFVARHSVPLHCNYDLFAFPMDTQNCAIEVQNSGADSKYTMELVDITSIHQLYSNSFPPDFQITKMKSGPCTRKDGLSAFRSCVEYSFVLQRHLAYHLMLTYAPSALIVLMSTLSFWLGSQCTAPRVALGVTSLLTLSTQFANVQRNLPPVAYVKSIDIWMFVCMFEVFGTLVEFTAVTFTIQQRQKVRVGVKVHPIRSKLTKVISNPDDQECRIDKIAKIVFPLSFFLFNLAYWSYYLSL